MVNHEILVIAPAYNESGKINEVVRKVKSILPYDIVVIDDCSTDSTYEEAKKEGAIVLRHKMNMGVGAALRTGIDYAINNNYDVVVIISGDDQHLPSEIPDVIKPICDEDYDLVQGSRRLSGKRYKDITLFRRLATRVFSLIFSVFSGRRVTDATNGFRAFKTSIFQNKDVNIWQDWLNTYELEPYLLFKVLTNAFKVKEVPITIVYHSKIVGWTKMRPVIDWWRIISPIILLKLRLRK